MMSLAGLENSFVEGVTGRREIIGDGRSTCSSSGAKVLQHVISSRDRNVCKSRYCGLRCCLATSCSVDDGTRLSETEVFLGRWQQ